MLGLPQSLYNAGYTSLIRLQLGLLRTLLKVENDNEYLLVGFDDFEDWKRRDLSGQDERRLSYFHHSPPKDFGALFDAILRGKVSVAKCMDILSTTFSFRQAIDALGIYYQSRRNLILPIELADWDLDVLHGVVGHLPILSLGKYRSVVTIYHMIPRGALGPSDVSMFYFYHPLFIRQLNFADRILVPSQNTRTDLVRSFKIPDKKLRVIHLPIDEIYKPARNKEMPGKRFKSRYILYVGTYKPRKNVDTLVRAFCRAINKGIKHKLVLAGPMTVRERNSLLNLSMQLGIQKYIIFAGLVPEEEMPALYSEADSFIFPSLYEGFGLPPLEAMACGTPVITSNTSSLPEIVGDAGILVDPHDVKGFANAMNRVLTDDGLKEEMARKGLQRAKLFTWETNARETLKVYDEVVNE